MNSIGGLDKTGPQMRQPAGDKKRFHVIGRDNTGLYGYECVFRSIDDIIQMFREDGIIQVSMDINQHNFWVLPLQNDISKKRLNCYNKRIIRHSRQDGQKDFIRKPRPSGGWFERETSPLGASVSRRSHGWREQETVWRSLPRMAGERAQRRESQTKEAAGYRTVPISYRGAVPRRKGNMLSGEKRSIRFWVAETGLFRLDLLKEVLKLLDEWLEEG